MRTDYKNELRFHVAFNFRGGEVFKIGKKAYDFCPTALVLVETEKESIYYNYIGVQIN